MLKEQIKKDLDQALKSQDKIKLFALRSLWAELRNREIDAKKELNDDEVISLIKKQIKILNKAKALFVKGGRNDLAEQNETEIKVLQNYLNVGVAESADALA